MKETIKETAEKLNKQFDTEIYKDNCEKSRKDHIEDILLDISLNKALSLVVHVICITALLLGVMLLGSALILISMAVEIHYMYSLIASIKIIICLTVGSILLVSSACCIAKLNEKN